MHDGTVRRLRRLAKVKKEARLRGLVVTAPLVSVAQLLLVVRRMCSWGGVWRVTGGVGVLLLLLLSSALLLLRVF